MVTLLIVMFAIAMPVIAFTVAREQAVQNAESHT